MATWSTGPNENWLEPQARAGMGAGWRISGAPSFPRFPHARLLNCPLLLSGQTGPTPQAPRLGQQNPGKLLKKKGLWSSRWEIGPIVTQRHQKLSPVVIPKKTNRQGMQRMNNSPLSAPPPAPSTPSPAERPKPPRDGQGGSRRESRGGVKVELKSEPRSPSPDFAFFSPVQLAHWTSQSSFPQASLMNLQQQMRLVIAGSLEAARSPPTCKYHTERPPSPPPPSSGLPPLPGLFTRLMPAAGASSAGSPAGPRVPSTPPPRSPSHPPARSPGPIPLPGLSRSERATCKESRRGGQPSEEGWDAKLALGWP